MSTILILTHLGCERCLLSAIQAGASGYLSKDKSTNDLMDSIRSIHAGEGVFDLEGTKGMLRSVGAIKDNLTPSLARLHNREQEILKLAARGMSNASIAYELGISTHTVASHLFHIFKKLGVQSRTEDVLHGLKQGLLTMDDLA